jgi:hypothetical protein
VQAHEAYKIWRDSAEALAVQAIKTLLEEKHLYQSVAVATPDLQPLLGKMDARGQGFFHPFLKEPTTGNWLILERGSSYSEQDYPPRIVIRPPDAKLYCGTCQRLEAFNFHRAEDFTARGEAVEYRSGNVPVQVLALSYMCQSCKSVPEVFIIRRVGPRLTLCGRAPMESVQVPAIIPKLAQRRYSAAVVAHQSGQTLAANFLLRVLIEEFARSQVEHKYDKADELMDAYMATLPQAVRDNFPSLRAVYGDLSADMHAGVGSADVFTKAMSDVERHFDARRLFRVEERKATA